MAEMVKKLAFLTMVCALLGMGVVNTAWAHEDGTIHTHDENPVITDVQLDSQSTTAELRRLKTQYRGEVEEYRRLESQYQVAKQQYGQLQTLSALEAGVSAAQAAMEARARVLSTYLHILEVSLTLQTGIEIQQKADSISAIEAVQVRLDEHHEMLKTQLDKVALLKASDEFELLGRDIKTVSYRALSLLAIGELQTIYDKSRTIVDDMNAELATRGGALKQAQRQRGFDETDRKLDEIQPTLRELNEQVKKSETSSESLYGRVNKDLQEVYTQLSQALGFLQELVAI